MARRHVPIRNFLISTDQSGGGGPSLRFTPLGVLSLSTGCVFDAPTIRQNGTTLDSRFMLKSRDESAAGNKTFIGLTRLEGGVYTRRTLYRTQQLSVTSCWGVSCGWLAALWVIP